MNKTEYLVMVAYGSDEPPYNNLICEGIFDTESEANACRESLLDNTEIEFVFVYKANKL